MTLSWSEYFSRWFLTAVVWHSGPWRTIYLSGGVTTTSCVQGDAQVSVTCCAGQWFHVSIKYYNGCYNTTNPSDMLQVNSSVSCFGGQTGTEMPSTSCSEGSGLQTCKESVTIPVNYKGNNISMVMETDCIKESDIHNVCRDLSDTVTGPLYLASPSLFVERVPSVSTKCRCEVHADSFLQMEILFADISVSRFTISCGQWNISENSFSTNVTNWMVPIPQDSSDCVLEVDERYNENTSYPVHKVWIKIIGSSLTFRCNTDTNSSSLTPPYTETSKADDSRSSSASSSSSSSQATAATTFFPVTSSNKTRSLQTQQDTIHTSSLTTFQTYSDRRDFGQNADDKASHLHIIYIVVAVVGGILLVIIVIWVFVVFLRKKKSNPTYDSLTHPNARRTRGGVHTEDNEHTYSVIRPAQRPDVQLTAAAATTTNTTTTKTTDGQGLPGDDLAIQTPGYENVGMTFLAEKSGRNCDVCHQYINVICDTPRIGSNT